MTDISSSGSHARTLWLLIGVGVLVRLAFLGIINLLPEEAYYWNYSRHIDIGYLDHPPMVAWLIYAFEYVLGRSELAVRLPAFLSWFVMAFYMYRFARESFDKESAVLTLLLLSALPIYMSVGFMMTPDAPFYAAWAACLYYLYLALLKGKSKAWIGVGVGLGLGLFSKYTMGLIVPSAIVFVLLDRDSRRWVIRWQPYVALLIGLLIFSPVIYWNFRHGWESFAFQGSRRWSGGNFDLHILIGSILVILTPIFAYEAVRSLWVGFRERTASATGYIASIPRVRLFMLAFTLVPLSVFIIHSLQDQPKLNWTGPVWMAILPLIASRFVHRQRSATRASRWLGLSKTWATTIVFLLVFYTAGFSYITFGMPGTTIMHGMPVPVAWRDLGQHVETIERVIEESTHAEPLIVGLDKYWISSQASFYDDASDDEKETLPEFGAQGLFGRKGLMWDEWMPPEEAAGRNVIIVSFNQNDLKPSWVTHHFTSTSPIHQEDLHVGHRVVTRFYWRVGYDYQP